VRFHLRLLAGLIVLHIFVDADSSPVKSEIYRVATRHALPVTLVANSGLRPSRDPMVRHVIVSAGFDAADDWIAEQVQADDVVVTGDIPLAARCLAQGAAVLTPTGKRFTEDNIGDALATRVVMADARAYGIGGGPPPFQKRDRSRFLQQLEETIQSIRRRQPRP
jgi:uncharacterized protein YaiI (UPF0178 family)